MTTHIGKWENDPAIKIPKELLAALHWHEGAELNIYVEGGKLILEPSKCGKTIGELFKDYEGDYVPKEIDWGQPTGDELW